ncbi:MAG: hypothetical protein ACOH2H_25360 [Cypionkella sp.]
MPDAPIWGLPDWGQPIAASRPGESPPLWQAFQTDGSALALPDALTIAVGPDGRPAFNLAGFRPLIPSPSRRGYGRLDVDFRLLASAATPDGAVRAVPALRGWLRLSSNALQLSPDMTGLSELSCSGIGLARLMLPLAAEGVALVERALASGATPILASVEIEVSGVAPRLPGHANVAIAALRAALSGNGMTLQDLTEAVFLNPGLVGIAVEDVPSDLPARRVAEAVADHIRARLCDGPLRPRDGGGLALVLVQTGIATGTARLDLSEVLTATRALSITLDPFATARDLAAAAGGLAALTTRTTTGTLQSGQYEISIDTSLARPCVGPLAFAGRLVFPPHPPERTHEVREDFELPDTGAGVVRQIRLAPNEALNWIATGIAICPTADGRGVNQLEGAARTGTGLRVLFGTADFPLHFVEVEAGAALLSLASVEVTMRGPGSQAQATLSLDAPRCALALPSAADLTLSAVLAGPSGALPLTLPDRPASDWRIELSDAPGYGARRIEIFVTLPEGVALCAIEILPEDAAPQDAPETLAFTPALTHRTYRWLCRDPFRSGLRWRWRRDPASSFSVPVTGELLTLGANEVATT